MTPQQAIVRIRELTTNRKWSFSPPKPANVELSPEEMEVRGLIDFLIEKSKSMPAVTKANTRRLINSLFRSLDVLYEDLPESNDFDNDLERVQRMINDALDELSPLFQNDS